MTWSGKEWVPTMLRKAIQRKHISEDEIAAACNAFHAGSPGAPTPDEALAHKYPVKVILSKMERMVDQGKLEYGVSLRTAWVTPEFQLMLRWRDFYRRLMDGATFRYPTINKPLKGGICEHCDIRCIPGEVECPCKCHEEGR